MVPGVGFICGMVLKSNQKVANYSHDVLATVASVACLARLVIVWGHRWRSKAHMEHLFYNPDKKSIVSHSKLMGF